MIEKVCSFFEQPAFVDRVAVAVAAELEKLLDGYGAMDESVDLWEFAECEPAEALVGGAIAGAVQVADLLEAEPDALGGVDDREAAQDALLVSAFPRAAFGWADQPMRLVVAKSGRRHAGAVRHLTDR